MRSTSLLSRGLALLVTLSAACHAHADTIYNQALTVYDGYFSSIVEPQQVYESFVLTTDATIQSVNWYGTDIVEIFGVPPGNPESFLVNFYADGGNGVPGALLSTNTIGNYAGATFTGLKIQDIISIFSYQGTLATPFQATAGTRYWISIVDPTEFARWYWASGSGPDNKHTTIIDGQVYAGEAGDTAFTLQGTVSAVPEPASMLLFAAGTAALLLGRRRRA